MRGKAEKLKITIEKGKRLYEEYVSRANPFAIQIEEGIRQVEAELAEIMQLIADLEDDEPTEPGIDSK